MIWEAIEAAAMIENKVADGNHLCGLSGLTTLIRTT
jgi:hypothetical protein